MSSLAMSVCPSRKNYWQQFWTLIYPVDWSQIHPEYRTEPIFVSWFQRAYFHVSLVRRKKFKFGLQIASYKFRCRQTFCTSLSSVEIHFQSNRYFTTFIVFSKSMYLCATFIKRIIHNLICSDALCMRNDVQCTLYIIVL